SLMASARPEKKRSKRVSKGGRSTLRFTMVARSVARTVWRSGSPTTASARSMSMLSASETRSPFWRSRFENSTSFVSISATRDPVSGRGGQRGCGVRSVERKSCRGRQSRRGKRGRSRSGEAIRGQRFRWRHRSPEPEPESLPRRLCRPRHDACHSYRAPFSRSVPDPRQGLGSASGGRPCRSARGGLQLGALQLHELLELLLRLADVA